MIDEAHQILSQASFQSQFAKIKALAPFPVQKIYMTGSLPIRLEKRFLLETGLSYSTKIMRSPSFQPQISYNVFKITSMSADPIRLAIDIAKFMETVMEPDQIGIIFCKSKREVDELQKRFTKCSSHSDLSVTDRAHNEESWRAGFHRWMAATTGLIQGIDAPNIGAVICIDVPYGLINLYQGAGRSGRDGRRSWAIIIDITNHHQIVPKNLSEDFECVTESSEFLKRDDCHRLPISELLDGRSDSCLDVENAHLCGRCDKESPIVAGITPLLFEPPQPIDSMEVDEANEPDEFDRYNDSIEWDSDLLELPFSNATLPATTQNDRSSQSSSLILIQTDHTFSDPPPTTHTASLAIAPSHLIPPSSNAPSSKVVQGTSFYHKNMKTLRDKSHMLHRITSRLALKCVLCWVYQGSLKDQHINDLFRSCKGSGQYIRTNWIGFKKLFKFPKYQYCFQCFLPQGKDLPPCHPTFHTADHQRKSCPVQDFVPLLLIFIRYEPTWWIRARQAFRSLPGNPNEQEYATWCQIVEQADNFYNGLELVLWFLYVFQPVEVAIDR